MCGGCDFDVFGEIKFTKILELQPTHIPYLTHHITSSPNDKNLESANKSKR